MTEVSFAEWTSDNRVRQAVFHGLRADKKAREVLREKPAAMRSTKPSAVPASIQVTHPDRVIDPSTHTTKIQLVEYYSRVAPLMMEHLKNRPVSIVRAPDGINGQLFFQKHSDSVIPGMEQLDPALDPDHPALLTVAKPEGLISAAQMNVIEFHTWNAVKSYIHKPDRMTFDLDPGEGVRWPEIQEAASVLHAFLQELQLQSFLKTSGGKGLHLVVPLKRLYDWDTVKNFSQAIVQHVAATIPQRFVAKSGPQNRRGKIYIDYLRNGFGATTIAAWSARARPGLGVSVPIAWTELGGLESSAQWNIFNIHTRLKTGNDPWKNYLNAAQKLGEAMKRLGYIPRKKMPPTHNSRNGS